MFPAGGLGVEERVTTSFMEQKARALKPATRASNPESLQSAHAKETALSQKR